MVTLLELGIFRFPTYFRYISEIWSSGEIFAEVLYRRARITLSEILQFASIPKSLYHVPQLYLIQALYIV